MESMQRLILGTAQLGLPYYGIANTKGRPDQSAANAMISTALEAGIYFFDTAQAYGESENVLGEALTSADAQNSAQIITKITPADSDCVALVQTSLQQLHVASLFCLMLHQEEDIAHLKGDLAYNLQSCLERGLTLHIGVSVYDADKALEALAHPLISVVQIPANLFDRRCLMAGVLQRAKNMGKEIHIRSVFLQGLLFLAPERLPPGLELLRPYVHHLHTLSDKYGSSVSMIALAWVLRRYEEARVIFGAENLKQVHANLDSARQSTIFSSQLLEELDEIVPPQTPSLLNPSLWR